MLDAWLIRKRFEARLQAAAFVQALYETGYTDYGARLHGRETVRAFAASGLADLVLRGLGYKNPNLREQLAKGQGMGEVRAAQTGEAYLRRSQSPGNFGAALAAAMRQQGLKPGQFAAFTERIRATRTRATEA